jgi:arylformamidase
VNLPLTGDHRATHNASFYVTINAIFDKLPIPDTTDRLVWRSLDRGRPTVASLALARFADGSKMTSDGLEKKMNALYRGMDRPSLDAAYNNVKAVADFPAILSSFIARGAKFYESASCDKDIPYGKSDRERFDLARSASLNAATIIYVHGGYWQTLTKEDFAFIAEGPLALGCNVALVEYTLAPQASMTQIVQEIGRFLDYIAENRDRLRIGRGPVALVGHSAGGHLSLLHRSHPLLTHTTAISPLVDLEPISLSWLNDKLNLSASEVDLYSPLRHIDAGTPMTIAVGAAELPELVRHAHDYAMVAENAGVRVDYVPIEGRNHFSILEELASPTGTLAQALLPALGGNHYRA